MLIFDFGPERLYFEFDPHLRPIELSDSYRFRVKGANFMQGRRDPAPNDTFIGNYA